MLLSYTNVALGSSQVARDCAEAPEVMETTAFLVV